MHNHSSPTASIQQIAKESNGDIRNSGSEHAINSSVKEEEGGEKNIADALEDALLKVDVSAGNSSPMSLMH